MRRTLPSTRYRRIGAFAALALLVALASFGLQASAETPQAQAAAVQAPR